MDCYICWQSAKAAAFDSTYDLDDIYDRMLHDCTHEYYKKG